MSPVDSDVVDMVEIPGGVFLMGSDRHYPEEAPVHRVSVDSFRIDCTPVTNHRFAAFVAASGYVTTAERAPDPNDYPGAQPEMMRAGSLVFMPPTAPGSRHWNEWWTFGFGADWRHPYGPDSTLDGLDDHPVVHVTWADATAFAEWAGKQLPTEVQWERAARGGREHEPYAWGHDFTPQGRQMANTWQGEFPHQNLLLDGYARTSPVAVFPANGFGLFDMIGNVWEWTDDWYADRHIADPAISCCIPSNPRGGSVDKSLDPCDPNIQIPRKVLKGGSHLCAPNYCQRYRPAARYPQPIDTSTSHVGFRCARQLTSPSPVSV